MSGDLAKTGEGELHGAGGPHESVVELRAAEGEEDGRKIDGEGAKLAPVVC